MGEGVLYQFYRSVGNEVHESWKDVKDAFLESFIILY